MSVVLPLAGHAESFDLGDRGQLEVAIPATWTAKGEKAGDQGFNILIKPNNDANAGVQLTVLFVQVDQKLSEEDMQKGFAAGLEPMLAGSVEKKADMEKLKLKDGSGFFASLTDASLVGKPSQPGNFKIMTSGMAKLSDGVIVALTLLSDDKTGTEFAEAMKMLESLTLTKK
ncbi:MAG TPA: hypothetical protein VD994_16080 [Prosthecobacter sp.]|nr:hypothetical protein [Prosthecobacter sp.]